MLRHSSKRSCPSYHGQPWPITGSRCWTRLTERRVPPPHPPVSPVSTPPHPIGHLEGHLAGGRRVTWWWVSPISPISPIGPPAPPGPHSRVATRRLPLLRGGGLPGLILAPGTSLLTPTPRVPFLLTPLVTQRLTPLVTPLPLVTTLVPLVPVIPVVPVVAISKWATYCSRRLARMASQGGRPCSWPHHPPWSGG